MASSAFKSTSKRGCSITPDLAKSTPSTGHGSSGVAAGLQKNAPNNRRSRRVSTVSRRTELDFSNKRDNPLFYSNDDSPPETTQSASLNPSAAAKSSYNARMGRFPSRNDRKEVDPGRRFRSASRNPGPRSTTECPGSDSELEQELSSLSDYKCCIKSDAEVGDIVDDMKNPTCCNMYPTLVTPDHNSLSECSRVQCWDDGGSGIFFSEAEEQTINEFSQHILSAEDNSGEVASKIYETVRSEVRKATCDIQNDLVIGGPKPINTIAENSTCLHLKALDSGPVELVLDIRREYVTELEKSDERARKLRADLAAEEHWGLELGRVLKELLPEPKVSNPQRCRPARKNSIERRRMSRQLTEEAMSYLEECISISTFDSSDFSSQEDPPLSKRPSTPDDSMSLAQRNSTVQLICSTCPALKFNQEPYGDGVYTRHDHGTTPLNESRLVKTSRPEDGNGNYNKNRDKDEGDDDTRTVKTQQFDMEKYYLQASAEKVLFGKVFFKNRMDSGSLHLCGGVAFFSCGFAFI